MPWIYDRNKLKITGGVHFNVEKIKTLLAKLKDIEEYRSKSIRNQIEELLTNNEIEKETIWKLTKWCHWSHKNSECVAKEIFAELFYNIPLERLYNQWDKPFPTKEEAEETFSIWLTRIVDDKIESNEEQENNEILEEVERRYNDTENQIIELNSKMKDMSFQRKRRIIDLIVRKDKQIVKELKRRQNYSCQFPNCNSVIIMRNGARYVEVAHILAVSKGGKSCLSNLLVLCPNHHKEFDLGELEIIEDEDKYIQGRLNGLEFHIKKCLTMKFNATQRQDDRQGSNNSRS